jgi:hypothetical protein
MRHLNLQSKQLPIKAQSGIFQPGDGLAEKDINITNEAWEAFWGWWYFGFDALILATNLVGGKFL